MRGKQWFVGAVFALSALEGCSQRVACTGDCLVPDAATDVVVTVDNGPPPTPDAAMDVRATPDVPSVLDVPPRPDVISTDGPRDSGPTSTCHLEMGRTAGQCLEFAQVQVFTRREFRVTQLEITAPAALASPVVGGILNPAVGAGTLLIGVAIAPSRATLRAGALNINAVTRGTLGRGLIDGLFDFYDGNAPSLAGAPTAWNPVEFNAREESGVISTTPAPGALVLPILTPNATDPTAFDLLMVLRLSAPRVRDVRMTADGQCIGGARFPSGRFNECASSQWCTRAGCASDGAPAGVIEGDLLVSDTQSVRLTTLPGMPTLCQFISGSDCSMTAPSGWMRPPDATVGGAPAWHFTTNFAAVSARIGP